MSRKAYFPREEYAGDASETAFTFDFLITDKSQLLVELYNSSGVLQYSVSGNDADYLSSVTFDETDGGGIVTFASAPASGYKIVFLLNPDEPTQDFEFRNKSSFNLRTIEKAFDYVVGVLMRLSYLQSRSIRIGNYMTNYYEFDPTLPSPEGNGGKILALNDDEDGMQYGPTVAVIEEWKDDAEAAATAAAASASASASSASASSVSASASASSAAESAATALAAATYNPVISTSNQTSLLMGAKITLGVNPTQLIRVGSILDVTLDSAPFSSTPTNPTIVYLICVGSSTVTMEYANSSGGFMGNGDLLLSPGETIGLLFSPTDNRWYPIGRSN